MNRDIIKKIRKLRKELNESFNKNGVNSSKTRKISDKMDKLINEYYSSIEERRFPISSEMDIHYRNSYNALKAMTEQLEKFPSVGQWNKFAKENNYLSNVSLEYISQLNWKYLQIKVEREKNMKNFKIFYK